MQEYRIKALAYQQVQTFNPLDHVILYPFVWDDKEAVVGGASRFDTKPQLAGEPDRTIWRVEMQKGVWPRGLDPAKRNFVTFGYQTTEEVRPEEFEPRRRGYFHLPFGTKPNDLLLTTAEEAARRFTTSFAVKRTVLAIMNLTGQRPICLEWYCRSDGKILAIDF